MFLLGSFSNWLKQLWINRGCHRRYIFFAAVITFSRLLTILPRYSEKLLFNGKIRSVSMDQAPIFIIGHWRSGTTFLHNVMSRDKNLGFMTLMQSVAPEMFMLFGKIITAVLKKRTPITRPMDNVSMSPDVPQEEEFAMANMGGGRSFYHQWVFPCRSRYYFEKYAILEDISKKDPALWKKNYKILLQKITLASGGRRLVLKNPANTARISAILDLFPDAKFIHIYRNPYVVFPSTANLYDKMIAMCGIQDVSQNNIEENILLFYQKLMKKYFSEKHLIPKGNLVEIKFEDLEADPMAVFRHIYDALGLPGFLEAESVFREYIGSLGHYQKNSYTVSSAIEGKIRTQWRFAMDEWGYGEKDNPRLLCPTETIPDKTPFKN